MKYRGIFEYEYPTEHKTPVSIDVYLHGDCVKGKIIEWEYRPLEQDPTNKNDLAVDCIDRVELLKAMNTYDKFGNDSNERLIFLSTPALQDRYVPYVHYDEMVNCVKGMPSVAPQKPNTGYISIDDAMSVFDDFMRGDVDEADTETFLEMLKDKAESEKA